MKKRIYVDGAKRDNKFHDDLTGMISSFLKKWTRKYDSHDLELAIIKDVIFQSAMKRVMSVKPVAKKKKIK